MAGTISFGGKEYPAKYVCGYIVSVEELIEALTTDDNSGYVSNEARRVGQ